MRGVTDGERDNYRARDANDTGHSIDMPALEPWIIDLLACPVDQSPVRVYEHGLVCNRCGRHYDVRAGIPRMIADDAEGEQ